MTTETTATAPSGAPGTPGASGAPTTAEAIAPLPATDTTLLDGAPVEDDTFELPEGVTLEPEILDQARALFAESGIARPQAQKLIDLAMSREQAAAQRGVQAFVDLQNRWVSEIKADPDIGGPRLTASLAAAARAIDRLAIPGLKDALNLTGAGNNPAIVKAFVRIGQLLSEDRFAPGRSPAPAASRSAAEILYDATPKHQE